MLKRTLVCVCNCPKIYCRHIFLFGVIITLWGVAVQQYSKIRPVAINLTSNNLGPVFVPVFLVILICIVMF